MKRRIIMKKSLSVFLCLLLTVGASFANGSKDAASAKFSKDPDFANGKFGTTRSITVEVFDRSNDGGTNPENNFYTDYIKAGMLKEHNVKVTFKRVPRWTEPDAMNNLLAAGTAPDLCLTYSMPTINTYAQMGGVLDIAPYLDTYKSDLSNLYNTVGDLNINFARDPVKNVVYAISAVRYVNARTATFVREDWLKKLNIAEPTNSAEFEAMLVAFKDNASTLLGKDAAKMIPFSMGVDVGWEGGLILDQFIPNAISDKDWWINGFCDRHTLQPGIKEGVRLLNKWYNLGLIWKDFPLYPVGDKTAANNAKAGYVGAFIGNWDGPYRDGDNGIVGGLHKVVGPDANYIAVDTFKNDAGIYRKYQSSPLDRFLFLPSTKKQPLASMMYLDFISKPEVRKFLQIGEEGVTHITQANGAIKAKAAKAPKIMNSSNNIDLTMTINGLDVGDPSLNALSLALGYAGVDPKYIQKSYLLQKVGARYDPIFTVGTVASESGQGPQFQVKRDTLLAQAVVSKPVDFDATWDNGMKAILASGVQKIIDERAALYEKYYGAKK